MKSAPPMKKKKQITLSLETFSDTLVFDKIKDASDLSDTVDSDPFSYMYFSLLWDNIIIDLILAQTKDHSNTEISRSELLAVFGVVAASVVKLQSRRRDFWSKNPIMHNAAISDSISVDCFEEIFSKLHFVPLNAQPSDDKYQKIRFLFLKKSIAIS